MNLRFDLHNVEWNIDVENGLWYYYLRNIFLKLIMMVNNKTKLGNFIRRLRFQIVQIFKNKDIAIIL